MNEFSNTTIISKGAKWDSTAEPHLAGMGITIKNKKELNKTEEIQKEIEKILEGRREKVRKLFKNLKNEDGKVICEIGYSGSKYGISTNFLKWLLGLREIDKKEFKIYDRIVKDEGKFETHPYWFYYFTGKYNKKKHRIAIIDANLETWIKIDKALDLIEQFREKYCVSLLTEELHRLTKDIRGVARFIKRVELKVCEKCGSENLKEALYCSECGIRFK